MYNIMDKDINDYDAADWEEFFNYGRRTKEGVRFNYEHNRTGRKSRPEHSRW